MTLNDMRLHILDAYPKAGMGWREKVTKMKPAQVIAIYKSIQERRARHEMKEPEPYHQIDIFEWMISRNENGSHTQIAL